MGPATLTGSLQLSPALAEDEPTSTVFTQIAQQDSQPPVTAIQPSIPMTQSSPVQPVPQPLIEESTSSNHTQESEAHGPKIAPSFGKKKAAFKPTKMHGNTTATAPSKLKQGKQSQVDKSPGDKTKVAGNKHTPLQTQPLEKVDEGDSKKGNDSRQRNSEVQKVIERTTSKPEKNATEPVDDEVKRTEKEKKKEEAAKKKLLQQQKQQEKEAEREQKKQERERKDREREEKKQEKARKEQERAQKKCDRELKKQEEELKKQEVERERLGKEQQKQAKEKPMDKAPLFELASNTTSPSPATLPTSVSMSSDSSQPESELTDEKGNSRGSGGAKEVDGRAEYEEMEDESKVHVDPLAASSNKEDDLDTTGKYYAMCMC